MNLTVLFLLHGGRRKGKECYADSPVFVLCEHCTEQEALPAEKIDQKVLSDTWHWNPLERGSVAMGRANVRFDFIQLFNQ